MADAAPRPAHPPDRTTLGLAALLAAFAAFTTWDQWAIWSTKDDYTFGYLVPVFAAYVLWDRWPELRALLTGERGFVSAPSRPWLVRLAGIVAFATLLAFALGAVGRIIYGTGAAATMLMAGGLTGLTLATAFLSARGPGDAEPSAEARWRLTGLVVFPAAVWLISGPFLYLVDNRIKLALLTNVTEIVSGFLRASDQAIRVSGNTIVFANGDAVGVADACSGIRSLSACVFAGAFLGALFLEGGPIGRLLRGGALLALSAGTALLLNIGRNTFLAFHALTHGSKSLELDLQGVAPGQPGFSGLGTVHDLAGNVAMGLALIVLIALVPALNRLGRAPRPTPSRMKILHLSPELAPWSKAGGLGDAVAALAKSMGALGHEVRVVTPLYGSVPGAERMGVLLPSLQVGVGGDPRKAGCRVRTQSVAPQVEAWFIEHEDYYGAREIYPPREDAGERAHFFARAGLDACVATGWIPDIIHCHDWTTGLIPPLLNTTLREGPLGAARSVLTIHNLQHQGLHPRRTLDFARLPEHLFRPDELECLGGVNYLKGGILHARTVLTVSPTYAREILTPAFGHGLEDVVRRRADALHGILNGVDRDEWDPARDPHLAQAFSAGDLAGKAACKAALLRELNLPTEPDRPVVGVISRLWDQKGLDLALAVLPRLLREEALRFVLLGSGDASLEQGFRRLAAEFPASCAVKIGYDHGLSHRIEAGADFFLMPSRFEPCGLNQMYSMAYATLPIVRETGGLADTVTPWDGEKKGTGVVFTHADLAGVEWGLRRALELYAQPKKFAAVRREALRQDFSWRRSAEEHLRRYAVA